MKRLKLKRISESSDCTLGVLLDNSTGLPLCLTLEKPCLYNTKSESCIPTGIYKCQPYSSEKYKNVYIITNVPNRIGILFHIGNTTKDTSGCILPGCEFGNLNGYPAVLHSKNAMKILKSFVGNERFELIIE